MTFNVGGSGNANESHFDFGTVFDPKGSCSSGGAGAAGGVTGGGEAADMILEDSAMEFSEEALVAEIMGDAP